MRLAGALVEAFADDFVARRAITQPTIGFGLRGVGAAFGQAQRARHHARGRCAVKAGDAAQRFFLSACLSIGTTSPPSSGSCASPGQVALEPLDFLAEIGHVLEARYTEAKRT